MKAITQLKYGGPEVLKLQDIEQPVPRKNEVLVKVVAAAINPLDWHFMRGTPYFMRLRYGFFKPIIKTLGADVSGVVQAVGGEVSQFQVGDHVFGSVYDEKLKRLGGLAEYSVLDEEKLVIKPDSVSHQQAAAVPIAGLSAYTALHSFASIKEGSKVLINGASGGVGTYAIQVAKISGAHVTGICSSKNVELVKSLGADEVIDYTKESLMDREEKYDIVVDNIVNYSVSDLSEKINTGGTGAIVGFGGVGKLISFIFKGSRIAKKRNQKIGLVSCKINQEYLQFFADHMESGKIKSIISKEFELGDAAKAIELIETGHAVGKIIINTSRE